MKTGHGTDPAGNVENNRPLIVFVHGAWHWGGCFQKVANLLARHGFPVAMPDLAGHGYDPTPSSDVRDMDDYVRPVTDILSQTANPVILLGHSLGGASLTYLGERYPQKICGLVYLAAYMCPPGYSVFDCSGFEENAGAEVQQVITTADNQPIPRLKLEDRDRLRSVFYGDCSEHDVNIALANLTPFTPAAPGLYRSDVTNQNFGSVPRAYIECTDDNSVPLMLQRRFQQEMPGAAVRTIGASHSPFFSMPEELAALIIHLVAELRDTRVA